MLKSFMAKISTRRIVSGIIVLSLLYLGLAFRSYFAVYKDQKHFYAMLIGAFLLTFVHGAILFKMDNRIETKSVTPNQVAALLFMLLFSMIGSIGLFASDLLLAAKTEFDIINKLMVPLTFVTAILTRLKITKLEKNK